MSASPALRFVVLRHDGIDEPHFDVMIETAPGSQLATWRSPSWPLHGPTELRRLRDHRPAYLTFEGTVGGGPGFVRQVASGSAEVESDVYGVSGFTLTDPPAVVRVRLEARRDDTCIAVPVSAPGGAQA